DIDVRHLDVTELVGGFMPRLKFDRERSAVVGNIGYFDDPCAGYAVEFGGEGNRLTLIGIGTGMVAGRLGVGDVLGYDAQSFRLSAEAGSRYFQGGNQRIHR